MSHFADIAVGKRVKATRKYKNMTQDRLAKKIGVTFQQVQKYETGANRISVSRLWKIGQALDVPASFFLTGLPGERS